MSRQHEDHGGDDRSPTYVAGSLSLIGAVSLGTGVMIGAGIFALTGQVAELAGEWFVQAFVVGALISGFSAYSYVRLANAYPSAGGIAMFLEKAYGRTFVTGACALLMYLSMVINESLVARTFGTYVLQPFETDRGDLLIPVLGVGLLVVAFLVNLMQTRTIQRFAMVMALVKIGGLVVIGAGGLAAAGVSFQSVSTDPADTTGGGFLAATALAILAYKGFTTIANSGGEIRDPHRNVGRAMILALLVCLGVYLMVALSVGSSLTVEQIVSARDYALAEAARPIYGDAGLWLTVGFAVVATVSGVIASVFAVSRMLAMVTQMHLVPHSHFGMGGSIQRHTLVYTVVLAATLTMLFDLSRIATLGAIFYLFMDMFVHWGVLRHLHREIHANRIIVAGALLLDGVVLGALIWLKAERDPMVLVVAAVGLVLVFAGERLFLRRWATAGLSD